MIALMLTLTRADIFAINGNGHLSTLDILVSSGIYAVTIEICLDIRKLAMASTTGVFIKNFNIKRTSKIAILDIALDKYIR